MYILYALHTYTETAFPHGDPLYMIMSGLGALLFPLPYKYSVVIALPQKQPPTDGQRTQRVSGIPGTPPKHSPANKGMCI